MNSRVTLEPLRVPILTARGIPIAICGLCGIIALLGSSCHTKRAAQPPWSFSEDAGVVFEKTGKVCFAIHDPSLQQNQQVRIVDPSTPQTNASAMITSANQACVSGDAADQGYEVALDPGVVRPLAPAIGIVNYPGKFESTGGLLSADLDANGQPDYFHSCTSSEGVHFSIWQGKPREGEIRWHHYYYLGYDISANCTPKELESPK